ncbi:MAG: metal-dependent hydrolase [Solirubrobacterales bacterium]
MTPRRAEPTRLAIALVGAIVCIDLLWSLVEGSTGAIAYGIVDEPAHLATCLVALLAAIAISGRRPPLPFIVAALIACVAIDVDHLPAYLGWNGLTGTLPRPYSHSLPVVLLLVGFGRASHGTPRQVSYGLAFGVATHLFRDLATGPGVPFLWPLTDATLTLPYAVCAVTLALAALAAPARRGFDRRRAALSRPGRVRPVPSAYPPSGS